MTAPPVRLAGAAQRAYDQAAPGFYIASRETGIVVRGPFRSWSEANLAVSYGWPALNHEEHEVVQR